MKRYAIWEKDDFFQYLNGERLDMDPSVVKLPIESCPLVSSFDYQKVIGLVKLIDLEDSEITGELYVFDPAHEAHIETLLDEKSMRLGGFYTHVEKHQDAKDRWHVIGCKLSGVSIIPSSEMPGAKVE